MPAGTGVVLFEGLCSLHTRSYVDIACHVSKPRARDQDVFQNWTYTCVQLNAIHDYGRSWLGLVERDKIDP
jgi:hypothetical protein